MDELRIIQYLDGEMPEEDLRNFEEEIRMNPLLAEELEKYRQVQSLAQKLLGDQDEEDKEPGRAVQEEIRQAVNEFKKDSASFGDIPPEYREGLKQAESSFLEKRGKAGSIRMISRIWYSAAAVVILAIVVSLIVFQPFAKITADEIYAQYFSPFLKSDEIIELVRADNDFLFATEVYEAGDFKRSAILFEILTENSELRAWSMFYAGSSYMFLNQTTEAIDLFQTIIREGDEEVLATARWQLALCYIRTGKPESAIEQLEILRNDPSYRRDANRILRLLR